MSKTKNGIGFVVLDTDLCPMCDEDEKEVFITEEKALKFANQLMLEGFHKVYIAKFTKIVMKQEAPITVIDLEKRK